MPSLLSCSLGKRIRDRRLVLGLTQEELAHHASCSIASLVRWEHGRALPSLDAAIALARALRWTLSQLVGQRDREELRR